MRVLRHKRQTDSHRAAAKRRPHVVARAAPATPHQPDPTGAGTRESEEQGHLRAERRMRASGGPEDRAAYRCDCGYAFEAEVSTSVACPHCGHGQAW